MASATVGILRVLLTANSAQFQTELNKARDVAKRWSRDLESIGTQAQSIGASMTRAFSLPIVAALGGAAKAAISFESSFANVAKTVEGVSDKAGVLTKEGRALAMTFRNMAKEIPATTDELTAIAALGGQMGVPIQNLEKFTKNVAALGVAVDGIGAEQAAAGLAQVANVFGDKEVRNIDKMSSALVHLGNSSNATESDILDFTKRLAGAGNSVGMTIPQVMALGTAMANVGLNAEAGGTAMSTVISKISKAVSEGGNSLTEFANVANMSADSFASVWKRSPIEALDAFVKGLSSMKARGVDLNLTMGELGTEGIRVADTLKRLAGAGDGIAVSLKTANEGFAAGNKHLEEAEKKYQTTANQLKLLWNQIKDVGITIGNAMLPGIKAMTAAISGLMPFIDVLAKMFAAMPGPVQVVVLGLLGVAAAAGPLIYLFGTLARSAADVTAAFGKNGIATRLLAADLGVAGTAVKGLIGFLGGAGGLIALLGGAAVAFTLIETEKLRQKTKDIEDNIKAMAEASKILGRTVTNINDARQVLAGFEAGKSGAPMDAAKATVLMAEAWQKGAASIKKAGDSAAIANEQIGATSFTLGNLSTKLSDATTSTDKLRVIKDKLAASDKEYNDALAKHGEALTLAVKNSDRLNLSTKRLADEFNVSEAVIERVKASFKAHAQDQKETEKAADALTKKLEKQREALNKLGLVTEDDVVKALGEFAEMVQLATERGVPLDKVLLALAPHLEDLRKKAKDSGVQIEEFADGLDMATGASKRLLQSIINSVPQAKVGLDKLPGTVVDLNRAMNVGGMQATLLTESYKFFGLSTRAELQQTARDAVAHFNFLAASGTASAEQLEEAMEKVKAAIRAAGGETETFGKGLKRALLENLEQIPGIIAGAVASGQWKSAFVQIGTMIGQTIGGAIGKALGGKWGEKIGEAFGALLGPLIDSLFKTEERKVNDLRDKFFKAFGPSGTGAGSAFQNLAAQLHTLGAEGDKIFQRLIRATSEEAFAAAVDDATEALGRQRTALSQLAEEGGVASRSLIAFLAATKDTAETLTFVKGQTQKAADGFNAYLKAGADAYTTLADLRKKYSEASGSEREDIAKQIREQEKLIAAIAITPTSNLAAVRSAMSPAELESLSAAYSEALVQGFTGTQDEFLRQQLDFYHTLEEGDARLKTWFSGATIDAFNAGAEARLNAAKTAMSPDELQALNESYQQALLDGFKGTQDEFLRQQLDFYSTLEEGDERLKAWFSGAALEAYKNLDVTSNAGALGAALAGTFGALVEQGMSVREALKAIEPGVSSLRAQLAATGQTGGEAFDYIARLSGIAADAIAGPALDAITHLSSGLAAAHNAGFLTQSMFDGLVGQIMASRQAIIDQGHASEDVNRLMHEDLQRIWQLQKDFGYTVDDTTQKLLDEAEAAGIVGDQHRSAMDRAALAMERAAKAIERAFGVAGDAAETFGRKVDDATRPRTVRVNFDADDFPGASSDPNPGYASRGALVTARGLKYFGGGGWVPRGTDTQAAMLSPGELILNEAQQSNIAQTLRMAMAAAQAAFHAPSTLMDMAATRGADALRSVTILEVDKRELGRAVADVLPGELRRLGVRVRA